METVYAFVDENKMLTGVRTSNPRTWDNDPVPLRNDADETDVLFMLRCLRARNAALLFCYDQGENKLYMEAEGAAGFHLEPDYSHVSFEGKHIHMHSVVSQRLLDRKMIRGSEMQHVAVNMGPDADYESTHGVNSSTETEIIVDSRSRSSANEVLTAMLGAFHKAIHRCKEADTASSSFHVFVGMFDLLNPGEIQTMHLVKKKLFSAIYSFTGLSPEETHMIASR